MKLLAYAVLLVSSLSLIVLLFRNRYSRMKFQQLIVHWLIAGVVLFGLNYFELTQFIAPPINLITLATTAILGLPGVALLVGVQYVL